MSLGSGMVISLSGGIATNVFDSFVAWVQSGVAGLLQIFGDSFAELTSPDLTVFDKLFYFLPEMKELVTFFGYALLFLIVVWQLFKAFGGKIVEGEDPMILTVRAMLFAVLLTFSYDIMQFVLDIAMVPFNAFAEVDSQDVAKDAILSLRDERGGLAFFNMINDVLKDIVIAVTPLSFLSIILTVVLLWNYLKLLLELCERYVVVGVLTYTSPLAFAMGASKATSDVFRNWCRMVGSQLFVVVMNIYFIKGFNVALASFTNGWSVLDDGNSTLVSFLVGYFCLIAYLRIASRFDEYLGQLGLNAAKTGTGPLGGLMPMMVGRTILSSVMGGRGFGFGGGRGFSGAGVGPASKMLGVSGIGAIASRVGTGLSSAANIAASASSVPQGFKGIAGMMASSIGNTLKSAVDPNTYVGNALGGQKHGFGGVVGMALNTAGKIKASAVGLGDTSLISALANSTDKSLNGVGGQAGFSDAQKFLPSLFNRQGLAFDAASQRNSAGEMAGQFTTANGKTFGVVASSMKANEAPIGPYGIMRAVDGSGFYVQTFDADGKVTEEGMAAFFGAPTIGDGAGQIASGDFASTFFPGQEGITNGLTFTNDENDPFILHATDADGHTFDLFNSAGYEKPENAIEGMTPTDVNGNDWFVRDTTPLDTSDVIDGVDVGSDGVISDASGNVVNGDTLRNIGVDYSVGEIGSDGIPYTTEDGVKDSVFGARFFPEENTEGFTFSNVDGDPYSFLRTDEDGTKTQFVSGAKYGTPDVPGEELVDLNGNHWYEKTGCFNDFNVSPDNPYTANLPVVDETGNATETANAYENIGNQLPSDAVTFKGENGVEQFYVPAPEGYEVPEGYSYNFADVDGVQARPYMDENGHWMAPLHEDDNGDYWRPTSCKDETPLFNDDRYEASVNPFNHYEATFVDKETGKTQTYQHEYLGNKDRAPEEAAKIDARGHRWYPVGESGVNNAQVANIEKSNASFAKHFGLDEKATKNIQFVDTSRLKSDGIATVYNRDSSAVMYVSDKGGKNGSCDVRGDYKEIKVNGETWRVINGTRGVGYRDTGFPDKDGNPQTKRVGEARFSGQVSRRKEVPLVNKFKTNSRGSSKKPKR